MSSKKKLVFSSIKKNEKTDIYVDGFRYDFFPAIKLLKEMNSTYIYGDVGVGKTWICKKLEKEFDGLVEFRSWYEIVESTMPNAEVNISTNFYKKADVLVIDDFGSVKVTDHNMTLMFKIIDYRTSNKLPTLLTSNYDLKKLHDKLKLVDEIQAIRIIDRIKCFEMVRGTGKSKR